MAEAAGSGAGTATEMADAAPAALSATEAVIYDRQLRLWGVEGQMRLRVAHALVVGMGALGAEIAKNLVLAGVRTTVVDTRITTAADVGTNFLLSTAAVGINVSAWRARQGRVRHRAAAHFVTPQPPVARFAVPRSQRAVACLAPLRELNRLVDVAAAEADVASLSDEQLMVFRCVILTDLPPAAQVRWARVDVCAAMASGCCVPSCPAAVPAGAHSGPLPPLGCACHRGDIGRDLGCLLPGFWGTHLCGAGCAFCRCCGGGA